MKELIYVEFQDHRGEKLRVRSKSNHLFMKCIWRTWHNSLTLPALLPYPGYNWEGREGVHNPSALGSKDMGLLNWGKDIYELLQEFCHCNVGRYSVALNREMILLPDGFLLMDGVQTASRWKSKTDTDVVRAENWCWDAQIENLLHLALQISLVEGFLLWSTMFWTAAK